MIRHVLRTVCRTDACLRARRNERFNEREREENQGSVLSTYVLHRTHGPKRCSRMCAMQQDVREAQYPRDDRYRARGRCGR